MAYEIRNSSNAAILFSKPHDTNIDTQNAVDKGGYLVLDEVPEYIFNHTDRYPDDFVINDLSKPADDENRIVTRKNYTPPT